jgi:acetyl-CoA/propionyl-CoA carboxylase, biotin carboxylase, biotin carboxyl carrier protein
VFSKILIANRGEIAVRIARTCRSLGVDCVAVYSDVDEASRHVAAATEAVHLPGVAPAETYLNVSRILDAARASGAEAVHPGYGFLSENGDFAEAVVGAGLVWVGPPPDVIRAVGDKVQARRIATGAGVPVVPGVLEPVEDVQVVAAFAAEHGYPVAVKAAGGGGGRGLKIVRSEGEIEEAFAAARREAQAYFGSSDVYVEKYLDAPKHLEVQILAPRPDDALWLGVRDCSLQRRHQKLIEETPPPRWSERAPEMGDAAVRLSKACGYVNAGTVEMLVDDEGEFYFLEVNARLQVEHTVTEDVLGVDLVRAQLEIASGDGIAFVQADLTPSGHSIECRINAEDPGLSFAPSPGRITRYVEPSGPGVRIDSGYGEGDEVPGAYDSLIAKLITHGETRDEARTRMVAALDSFVIEGVATTIPAHRVLLEEESFVRGDHTTRTVESGALEVLSASAGATDVLLVEGQAVRLWNPAMAASASAAVHGGPAAGEVLAPMQGTIVKVLVAEGDAVAAGDPLLVLEAMKMETTLTAPKDGVVAELEVAPGDATGAGTLLLVLE